MNEANISFSSLMIASLLVFVSLLFPIFKS